MVYQNLDKTSNLKPQHLNEISKVPEIILFCLNHVFEFA